MKRKLLVLMMAAVMLATVLPGHAVTTAMAEEDVSEAVQVAAEVTVRVKLKNTGDIYYGDRVTLVAEVKSDAAYTVAWEYLDVTPEQPVWVALATGETYAFEVTAATAARTYRAVVNGQFASAGYTLPSIKEREEVVEPVVTEAPTEEPAPAATEEPTEEPAPAATEAPTEEPEVEETEPTEEPAPEVTEEPTEEPEVEETEPTEEPAPEATEEPTEEPAPEVTEEPAPEVTEEPTEEPEVEETEPTEDPAPEATEEPTEEPAPEVTEEPTEEPAPEATEEPIEEPEAELNPDRDIKVTAAWEGEELYFGDLVTLTAELIGYENAVYIVQWQTSEDGVNWTDVEGATELIYEFAVTEENCQNYWRLIVNVTGVLVGEE